MKKINLPSEDIKKFLLRFFALVGVLASIVFLILYWGLSGLFTVPETPEIEKPESIILTLDFTKPIVDRPKGFSLSLDSLLNEEITTPLPSVLKALKDAKDDPAVKAVVARFSATYAPSLTQVQEILPALKALRESGKPTFSFATSYGSFSKGSSLYLLASQFENRWLQPVGSVALTGIGITMPFAKKALDKLGVRADFMRRREYKSFMENAQRDDFSPAVRENMESLIGSLQNQIKDELASSLKLSKNQAMKLISSGPYTAKEALEKGLITKIGYDDELGKEIEKIAGDETVTLAPQTYARLNVDDKEPKSIVAIVYANGMIVEAPPSGPSRLAQNNMIDTEAVINAFDQIAENPKIKAVLFRVSSPGGSPVASESIRRALIRVKESGKPVYVSMGSMAASGGYWISMSADTIFANPGTITGSIGVVSGKFTPEELFKKLGISFESLTTAENADLWRLDKGFSPMATERLNAMMDETYMTFVRNVSKARKIPMSKMADVARGRVFTGTQAKEIGLVDELGGIDDTLMRIRKDLKLENKDKMAVAFYPPIETTETFIKKLIGSMRGQVFSQIFSSPEFSPIKETLAPVLWSLENTNPVQAVSPFIYDINE